MGFWVGPQNTDATETTSGSYRCDALLEMENKSLVKMWMFMDFSEGCISTEDLSVLLSLAQLVLRLPSEALCSQMPRDSFYFCSKSR